MWRYFEGIADCRRGRQPEKDPTEFGVVSIGALHGGTAENIIPDDVVLLGTIPEVRQDACKHRADSKGGRHHVEWARARDKDH